MVRRLWFLLSAWFVLFVFVVSLLASPARHRMFAQRRVDVVTHQSRHGKAHRRGLPKKITGLSQAPSNGAWRRGLSGGRSQSAIPQRSNGSGWSFAGENRWVQKLIDVKRSWTVHSDPPSDLRFNKTAKNPTPSVGIGVSGGSAAAVGGTGHPHPGALSLGTGSGGVALSGSGSGSGSGGTVPGSNAKGGSGTASSDLPVTGGPGSASGNTGSAASGTALSGGESSGSGSGGSGSGNSASVPPPVSAAATPNVTFQVDAQNPNASDASSRDPSSPYKSINGALRAASQLAGGNTPATIVVHPGTYRETVIVQRPVVLLGQAGAEIRGSDPWSTAWTHAGNYWTHAGVPTFHSHGSCERWAGQQCLDPVHVFYDGKSLWHVDGAPTTGQFAVTPDRVLILADTPEGHLVEVTTRPFWVVIASSGVTVKSIRMKHAANDAQSGAIDADGYSNITVADNVLSDTHGAVVSVRSGNNARIIRNDISNGGQLGVHLFNVKDSLIQSNRIHTNNVDGFNSGWEAGGLKAVRAVRLTVMENEVYANDGPGLWCDGDCQDVVFSNNRIHDNTAGGIQYEISHSARIFNNVVWKNGLAYHLDTNHWGWGAGILVQNSNGCEVFNNTLAWNSNGIVVLEQNRGPAYLVFNTTVHDNTIVSQDAPTGGIVYALAWLSDYPTNMYALSQANTGSLDKYGYSGAAESGLRFAWGGSGYNHLADFNATPGEHAGVYLTRAEQDSVLSAMRIPLSP